MSKIFDAELTKHEDKPLPPGVCATCGGTGEVIGPEGTGPSQRCLACSGTGKGRAPLAHACTDYNASGQWKKASEEIWRCGRCGFPKLEHEIAAGQAMSKKKPCFECGAPAPTTFDARTLFDAWAESNAIIASWRCRFDAVRARLEWAAVDETDTGAHPLCALRWAIRTEGFAERYPVLPEEGA